MFNTEVINKIRSGLGFAPPLPTNAFDHMPVYDRLNAHIDFAIGKFITAYLWLVGAGIEGASSLGDHSPSPIPIAGAIGFTAIGVYNGTQGLYHRSAVNTLVKENSNSTQ